MRVLVTGATGFVGTALLARLIEREGYSIRAAVRRASSAIPPCADWVVVDDLGPLTDWGSALGGVEAVIHLAARVHVRREMSTDPLAQFRLTNVAGTLTLAQQAAASGVRRLVFLSSVKVNGEVGAFAESDAPAPSEPYGISKHEAELGLREIAVQTGMAVVIIRSPLVYGPGVRANFGSLIRAIARGIPLPLGAVDNRRSLVALPNLVDLIITCIEHPSAANETFFVSDGEDLSTTQLIRRLAHAMGRPARLVPVPASLLMTAAMLVGKRHVAQRLLGSLQVDIAKAHRLLGWLPPVRVDEGLRRAVAGR